MTAATATDRNFDRDDTRLSRLLEGPAEGWLTLAGVAVMIVALAWSIDDSRWVNGAESLTDFLPLVGLAGAFVGFVGPKLGWGRWTTHLIGVAFAAIVLPIISGGIVLGDEVTGIGPAALAARYREAAHVIVRVWIDLGINGLPRTSQYGHYFIAIGALVWATGQFAAYAVFGHRRALDAVIVTGLVLLANMSITANNQLHLMVLFTLAGLVVLTRSHAFEERVTWIRRRIGDPATVTGLYLRGGAVFICGAVLGALILTATASSAPLQGLWRGVPGALVEFSQWLQRYAPLGGSSINGGVVTFGESSTIIGAWNSGDEVAFTAQVPAGEKDFYWQADTYANFDGDTWTWGTTSTIERAAGEELLAKTAENAAILPARHEVTLKVTTDRYVDRLVISPMTIESVDRDATLRGVGPKAYLAAVQFDPGGTYEVTALLPVEGIGPGEIDANRLRVASRVYPSEITRLYAKDPGSVVGPKARAILAAVMELTPDDNPYDIARTMEAYLRSSANFRYDTNVQDEIQDKCNGLSTVECFATIKAGYCQYYATTMAILLREAKIPARLAQGFLPGDRSAEGTEVVRVSRAHAWVQVFFPAYGWVNFDPTGGGLSQQLVPPPSGPPETPTPAPSLGTATEVPDFSDNGQVRRTRDPAATGGTNSPGPTAGPFIAIGGLLVIAALALAFIVWRRGPRQMHPDRAWGSIGRWAGWFGLAPRASQTVYEYAGVLGDAVPIVRPELSTVANAKVEISYGRRDLGPDRMRAVAEAHRRLRLGLLRLAFRRRPHMPRAPRPPRRG